MIQDRVWKQKECGYFERIKLGRPLLGFPFFRAICPFRDWAWVERKPQSGTAWIFSREEDSDSNQ